MRPLTRTTHLVSLATAAHYLAISTSTVRRRIADGTVTGYRIGRLIRVDLDEVIERLLIPITAPNSRHRSSRTQCACAGRSG